MSFILALDQGTTSSRALVFDEHGAIRAVAQKEFRQIFPQPGWVEHDPNEIWATQLAVATEAMARAGATAGEIAAIGIANQTLINTAVPESRARANTLFGIHVWGGNAIGAYLTSWAFAHYGWLAVCGVALAASVLALLIHARVLPVGDGY